MAHALFGQGKFDDVLSELFGLTGINAVAIFRRMVDHQTDSWMSRLTKLNPQAGGFVLELFEACLRAGDQDGAEKIVAPLVQYVVEENERAGSHLREVGGAIAVYGNHTATTLYAVSYGPGLSCTCKRFRGEQPFTPGVCSHLMLLAIMLAIGQDGQPGRDAAYQAVLAAISSKPSPKEA